MPECPWPDCDYEGEEDQHLDQHLEAKHDGVVPKKEGQPVDEDEGTPLEKALTVSLVGLAVILGTYQRAAMGTFDILQKFDPYEHLHLARYWMENGQYMVRDQLLFPGSGGQYPGVGYSPLTHFEPAFITQFFNSLGYPVSLIQVMATLPIVLLGLTTVAMYFLGKEVYGRKAGVVAAFLTSVFPAWVEVGRAGAYDTNVHLFFFTVLTLALFVKSLNQQSIHSRLYWGALGGVSLGLFSLHWTGYVMVLGFLGLSIVLYTAVASIVDRLEPGAFYSFVGIATAAPVMAFWHLQWTGLSDIKYVFVVAAVALFVPVAHRFPTFIEERFDVQHGYRLRHYTAIASMLLAGWVVFYTIQSGRLPGGISAPGVSMFDTSGSFQVTIAELQNAFAGGQKPLQNAFGALGGFSFGSSYLQPLMFFPIPFIVYSIWRDFHPKRFVEFTFVTLSFLMIFEAARFVEPFSVVVTLTIGGFFAWLIDAVPRLIADKDPTSLIEDPEPLPFAGVTAVVVALLVISTTGAPIVSAGPGNIPQAQPAIALESSGAWLDTYQHMADSPDFDESTAVMSWWDYGFPAKGISQVQYVSDNTQKNIEIPAKFYVMQNLSEGRKYLTKELMDQRGEDVDYVVGNKYLGFSGKWHATVTVASVETEEGTPNLFDNQREAGEEAWSFTNQGVGSQAAQSNYFKLSFYNASRYGVGDEPYSGYTIKYQSPQWYVSANGRTGVIQKSQMAQANISMSQAIGPAITIYEVQDWEQN